MVGGLGFPLIGLWYTSKSARIETNKQWLVCFLDKWCPELPTSSPWQHSNAFHHIQSLFLSPSLTIVIHCVPVMVHSSRKFPLRSDCADSVPRALRALQVGRAVQKNCAEAWSCLVFVMYMHWCMILHPGCFKTEGECSLRWCNWKKDIRLCQVCLHFCCCVEQHDHASFMHHCLLLFVVILESRNGWGQQVLLNLELQRSWGSRSRNSCTVYGSFPRGSFPRSTAVYGSHAELIGVHAIAGRTRTDTERGELSWLWCNRQRSAKIR